MEYETYQITPEIHGEGTFFFTNTIAGSLLSSDREEECVFLCRNLQGTQILS